ncbi:MAG: putative metal-binding motif-containing protein [Nanoarchaeota archaeon]|nr:putative metal-binding motif-containing protein [Nanoarchaeota archaeon]
MKNILILGVIIILMSGVCYATEGWEVCDSGDNQTTCTITTSHTITNDSVLVFNNLIIGSGGSLTASAMEFFTINAANDVTIQSGGSITGNANITSINLTIDSGGAINADQKGYPSQTGPGNGTTNTGSNRGGGGACYSGNGGNGYGTTSNCNTYGSLTEPTDLGSGGGKGYNYAGGAGGGRVFLNITDTLIANGLITANGGVGVASSIGCGGGGSGGSIYLITDNFEGNGSITSEGGNGAHSQEDGGGGSGGRIAIYYNTKAHIGNITVHGGWGYRYGGMGTLSLNGEESIPCDSGDKFTTCYISTDYTYYGDRSFSCNNLIINSTGSFVLPSTETLTLNLSGYLDIAGSINSSVNINTTQLTIQSSSSIIGNTNITATNLTIDSGGAINADQKGYPSQTGPGNGTTSTSVSRGGGGACYGGKGGNGRSVTNNCNAYGSLTEPIDLGSGGGKGYLYAGGAGGGRVFLNITDTLIANGPITANGGAGVVSSSGCGGGGSGGSIYLITNNFEGNGSITSDGGAGGNNNYDGGGGSGGRIAIYYTTDTHTGNITVHGAWGYRYGGMGTISLNGEESIPCDSGDKFTTCYISTLYTYYGNRSFSCNNLIINSTGSFVLPSTETLTLNLSGYLDIAGSINSSVNINTTQLTIQSSSSIIGNTNITATNLTIDSGGAINADQKGYPSQTGPGNGTTSTSVSRGGGGACYGGKGGNGRSVTNNCNAYGSLTEPIDLGSGGGKGYLYAGGAGGGRVFLNITDTLIANGPITANGGAGVVSSSGCGGGGSGGSIYLITNNFEGNGSITSDGGAGGNNNYDGGGGSGGRIAIYYTTDTHTGNITVHGAWGYRYGGMGTISLNGEESIPCDSGDKFTTCYISTLYTYYGNRSFSCNNLIINSTGSFVLPSTETLTLNLSGYLDIVGSINSSVNINTTQLTIQSSSSIIGNTNITATNLTIDSGGAINADQKGYPSQTGPGNGTTSTRVSRGGGGACYGGKGGNGRSVTNNCNAYGSLTEPTDLGSGGGKGYLYVGGAGGGRVFLNITDTLIANGPITANGGAGVASSSGCGGGGSGGSIYLITNNFEGNGSITSDGGAGGNNNYDGGGGSGGRIAIYYTTETHTGNITVQGAWGYQYGCAGTIYSECEGCIDDDGDGYGAEGINLSQCTNSIILGDCNDSNANVHPGAADIPGNGIDEDCSGTDNVVSFEVYLDFIGQSAAGTYYVGDDVDYQIMFKVDDIVSDESLDDLKIELTDSRLNILKTQYLTDLTRQSAGVYTGTFTSEDLTAYPSNQGIRLTAYAYDSLDNLLNSGIHASQFLFDGTTPLLTSTTYTYLTDAISNYTVKDLAVNSSLGKVDWTGTKLDLHARNIDLDSALIIGDRSAYLDSAAYSELNNSAVLTFYYVNCASPYVFYSETGNTRAAILAENRQCHPPRCTNIQCIDSILTVTVNSFTGYAVEADANLTIDADDSKLLGEEVHFTADYRDVSDDSLISGANCTIYFTDGNYLMVEGTVYTYNRTFITGGIKEYNVTCIKGGFSTLTAFDNVTIGSVEIPEFSLITLGLGLVVVLGGLIVIRKKR